MESPSGRGRTPRKRVKGQPFRGFKSHLHRSDAAHARPRSVRPTIPGCPEPSSAGLVVARSGLTVGSCLDVSGLPAHRRPAVRPRRTCWCPPPGCSKSNAAFFRRVSSGAGREILTDTEIAGYHARVTRMARPDMLAWLHSTRPAMASGGVR